MASTYTTNLNLEKPDPGADININPINSDLEDIDDAVTADRKAMAIISKGNTHGAIASGEYVYVFGHGTLTDGLYKANNAISANATLTTSNLTAVSGGGLNDLMDKKVNTDDRVMIDRNRNNSLADCNTITNAGMYRLISSTQNRPNSISYGVLIHMMSNDYIAQFVINTAGSVMAIRGKTAGSWNAWKLVTLTNDT